jgi:hypothetical protein
MDGSKAAFPNLTLGTGALSGDLRVAAGVRGICLVSR